MVCSAAALDVARLAAFVVQADRIRCIARRFHGLSPHRDNVLQCQKQVVMRNKPSLIFFQSGPKATFRRLGVLKSWERNKE